MAGILDFAPAIVLLPFLSFLIALGAGRHAEGRRARRHYRDGWVARAVDCDALTVADGEVHNEILYTWTASVESLR